MQVKVEIVPVAGLVNFSFFLINVFFGLGNIMKYQSKSLLCLIALGLLPFYGIPAANAQTPQQIAKKALDATVLLVMKDANGELLGLGSGFFVHTNQIATNFHVIEGAARGSAKRVGQKTEYTIEGFTVMDKKNDLAILQVSGSDVQPLSLGNSDIVEIGEPVYVAGNPKGFLEGTFSDGIISAIRGETTDKLFQMTAPISSGSSGGPVLNGRGEVIGVSVATFRDGQNLNFAIPSNNLKALIAAAGSAKPLPKEKPSFPEPVPEAGEVETAKAKAILADVIEAHGGLDKLKWVKNIVTKGKMVVNTPGGMMELDGQVTIVLPAKARADLRMPAMGLEMSRIYDGQAAWMVMPQGIQHLPAAFAEEAKKEIFRDSVQLLIYISDPEVSAQFLGTEDVKGKMADVILVSDTPADTLKLFIDQETKHIIKREYQALTEQGPAEREEFLDDYREVSGVMIAFHTVLIDNGEQSAEITFSEAMINVEIDESLFEK